MQELGRGRRTNCWAVGEGHVSWSHVGRCPRPERLPSTAPARGPGNNRGGPPYATRGRRVETWRSEWRLKPASSGELSSERQAMSLVPISREGRRGNLPGMRKRHLAWSNSSSRRSSARPSRDIPGADRDAARQALDRGRGPHPAHQGAGIRLWRSRRAISGAD